MILIKVVTVKGLTNLEKQERIRFDPCPESTHNPTEEQNMYRNTLQGGPS